MVRILLLINKTVSSGENLRFTNENPGHGLCPPDTDSWCKYRKAHLGNKPYDHIEHLHLSPVIMDGIKPIFRQQSNPNSSCLLYTSRCV